MKLKRSTAGVLGGLFAAAGQAMIVPPTTIQEIFKLVFHVDVSVNLAAFIGTLAVGAFGWLATEFQEDKTETQAAKAAAEENKA